MWEFFSGFLLLLCMDGNGLAATSSPVVSEERENADLLSTLYLVQIETCLGWVTVPKSNDPCKADAMAQQLRQQTSRSVRIIPVHTSDEERERVILLEARSGQFFETIQEWVSDFCALRSIVSRGSR